MSPDELERILRDGTLPDRDLPRIDVAAAEAGLLDVAYATLDSPLGGGICAVRTAFCAVSTFWVSSWPTPSSSRK